MKAAFKYQFEFTGISIFALCAIGGLAAFGEWGWIAICGEAIVFDIATSALSQYLKWRKA